MSILSKNGGLRAAGAALVLAISVSAPAAAQDMEEQARDIAETPLEDVGLSKDEIPEVLRKAALYPYALNGLDTCNAMVAEIARLDNVLGDDFDIAAKKGTGIDLTKVAKSAVGSIIPFRGIVREVSGAAGNAREAAAAVNAGLVRRAYLKGLGQGKGCKYPARPKGT